MVSLIKKVVIKPKSTNFLTLFFDRKELIGSRKILKLRKSKMCENRWLENQQSRNTISPWTPKRLYFVFYYNYEWIVRQQKSLTSDPKNTIY